MNRMRVAAVGLVVFAASLSGAAQQPLPAKAERVRRQVETLQPQDRISVIPVQGEEEYGSFVSHTETEFTFHDVDRKSDVALRYDEVKKVKPGYGGYNSLRHRHVDRERQRLFIGIMAGALVGLVVAVAVSM